MISSISLKFLNKDEYFQFISDILSLVQLSDPSKIKIRKAFDLLDLLKADLTLIASRERGSALTKEINALDVRRDDGIIGLRKIVDGNTRHKDEAIRNHALNLLKNIDSYGSGIASQGLSEETATLTKLHFDWTTIPQQIEAIAALNLSVWITEIDEANKLFNKKYLQRAQETGNTSSETITKKREETDKAYLKLNELILARFNAAIEDNEDPASYRQLINSINAIIEKYNTLIVGRVKADNGSKIQEAVIVKDGMY